MEHAQEVFLVLVMLTTMVGFVAALIKFYHDDDVQESSSPEPQTKK